MWDQRRGTPEVGANDSATGYDRGDAPPQARDRALHQRVKVGGAWRSGTAHILEDDDPRERMRWLKRPLNDSAVRAIGTQQLVIRVDLD